MCLRKVISVLLLCIAATPCCAKKKLVAKPAVPSIPENVNGVWLNVKYYNQLLSSLSPLKALHGNEYTAITLYQKMSRDKITGNLLINFHEGVGITLLARTGMNKGCLKADMGGQFDELRYFTMDGNDLIKLYHTKNKKTDTVFFMKINNGAETENQDNLNNSLSKLINEITLSGSYTTKDGNPVLFNEDGTVDGLGKFRKYEVPYDMVPFSIDLVYLDEKMYSYVFKNNGDKLLIYSVTNPDAPNAEKGKLLYSLTREGIKTEEASEPESPIVGGDSDDHGCKGSAGYAWSQLKKECIRWWQSGMALNDVNGSTQVTWLLFSDDKKQAEVSIPGNTNSVILTSTDKKTYTNGKLTLTTANGYVLKKEGKAIYQAK